VSAIADRRVASRASLTLAAALVPALAACSDRSAPPPVLTDSTVAQEAAPADSAAAIDRRAGERPAALDTASPGDVAPGEPSSSKELGPATPDLSSTCLALSVDYAALLALSKKCTLLIPFQCSTKVADELACPCDTHVNASSPYLTQMKSDTTQWAAAGCGSGMTCPGSCPSHFTAWCNTSGQCEDL
jgi:hypothetical protein